MSRYHDHIYVYPYHERLSILARFRVSDHKILIKNNVGSICEDEPQIGLILVGEIMSLSV